jgi:hypothetical protein
MKEIPSAIRLRRVLLRNENIFSKLKPIPFNVL